MFKIRIHPEAEQELADAIQYISERTQLQGTRFADAYHAALLRIKSRPEQSHFIWREFRRYNIPKSSYALIYRQRGNEISLIAIMHERRHPDYWKHRIEDDI